jgi:hypothetical protein
MVKKLGKPSKAIPMYLITSESVLPGEEGIQELGEGFVSASFARHV